MSIMGAINNGGAQAIKGFNYQKSVIALIAVLHYLDEEKVDIYIESEDDIVVKTPTRKTYIQSKGADQSIAAITKREDGKTSILEKNLSNGTDHEDNRYKIVTPRFGSHDKHLSEESADIFTEGAQVFSYVDTARTSIIGKLPGISEAKLLNSRVAVTSFPAKQADALTHVKGVMSNMNIPIDNSHGSAALGELCLRIDQKSEIIAKDDTDYEKKKITQHDLQRIFGHTYKAQIFEDITNALGYSIMKRAELLKKNATIGAIFGAYVDMAIEEIRDMDNLTDKDERTVIDQVLRTISFTPGVSKIDKEAIAINALSCVMFERSQVC
jgi:hypothetical protein